MRPTSTEIYETENLNARTLRKSYYTLSGPNNKRVYRSYSITWQLWQRVRALKGLISYVLELIYGGPWLWRILKLRRIFAAKSAIVCGNGPSQGFLDLETLRAAKTKGFHIIVINFFLENRIFYEVAPDIFVISDVLTWKSNPREVNPDPDIDKMRAELKLFIKSNKEIIIFCPVRLADEISSFVGAKRVNAFSDSELRGWTKNITPIFPRGYISATAYKALSLAIWLGYKRKYIIGIDNTYPREVFCDSDNRIMERATHACTLPYLRVYENCFESMGEYLGSFLDQFYDLRVFPRTSIINLDEYSLTDRFPKISLKEFRGIVTDSAHW